MKVATSYISSNYRLKKTIKNINESSSDYIHMDIMDGKYVENKNFSRFKLRTIFKNSSKALDVHLMVINPEKYLKYFKNKELVKNIFFHIESTKKPLEVINGIKKLGYSPGIVINPNETIEQFKDYYREIDRVLVMSVIPGAGGQKFINKTIQKLEDLISYKKKYKEYFEIAVDGGVNDNTIKKINHLKIDYVISGSYICKSDDYEMQIQKLR